MDQFRDRAFFSQDIVHSSFAYRVGAVKILGTILQLDRSIYARDSNETVAVEASLNSWLLLLPPAKREILSCEGQVDEMLFQAHMIINASVLRARLTKPNDKTESNPQMHDLSAPTTVYDHFFFPR